MAIKYLAGKRIQGTAAEIPNIGGVTGWTELGRTTLSSAGDTITVTGLSTANYPYLMILQHNMNDGAVRTGLRFNGDTGNNYCHRRQVNGGSTATNTSTNRIVPDTDMDVSDYTVNYFINNSDQEKLGICSRVHQSGSGSGNAPEREEIYAKWSNTSDSVTSVTSINTETGSFDTGSEIVVLGAGATGGGATSAWQELADVTTSSAGDVDTGTFTAKKYLWVQINSLGNGAVNNRMRFNNDSSGNYAYRVSGNGGSDSAVTTPSGIPFGNGNSQDPDNAFDNFFIINVAAKEKLVTGETITDEGTGAGNAPQRNEIVAKWDNTSAQINRINLVNTGSGNHSAGSTIKVWGFD
jgi:hypothetical protein